MKKFLTVLLALSVVFTYSFATVGTAFAAEEYTLDDYTTALTAEKNAQINYLNSAKTQAIGIFEFNNDGFEKTGNKYMKAAYEAAADKAIEKLVAQIDVEINRVLNTTDWPKPDAPDRKVVSDLTTTATTADGMKTLMLAETETLNKVQAPLTKTFVEGKLNVDLSKYNSTDKKYDGNKLTAVQYVQKTIDVAKEAIKNADKATTDEAKIAGYQSAYDTFKTTMAKVKTIADEEFESGIGAGSVDVAVDKFAKDALDTIAGKLNINPNMGADATVDWSTAVKDNSLKEFWEADETNANKGELFGVAIANIEKVTRNEVSAVNNAYKTAVASAKAPLKAYANGDATKIENIQYPIYTLSRAVKAVEVYADVVATGEKMKAEYLYGVKTYDDAKVDKAVKDAEQLVYDDLLAKDSAGKDKPFDTPENYIIKAADGDLYAVNFEAQKFEKAIEDAAKKMYKNGTKLGDVQVKESYGDNKTPEADLVYLQGTYYDDEATKNAWEKIAKKAVADLEKAQSYDEINAIMAKAGEDFGKLLKADGAQDVLNARADYTKELNAYGMYKYSVLDKDKYDRNAIEAAIEQGQKLIAKATTVEAVKAAFEEGKALLDGLKTKDELKDAKEAVEKQISALPYTSTLTVADKEAVRAAYEAYDAYRQMAGAGEIAEGSLKLLKEKYDKVNELEAKAINEKAKALNDQLDKLSNSDADVAKKASLKADAEAVLAEAEALNDEIDAVNEDYDEFLNAVAMSEVTKLDGVDFMDAVVHDVEIKLVNAAKDGASVADMKAALDAFNALTDRQQYELDESVLPLTKVIKNKIVASIKAVKVVKNHSVVGKGYIKLAWSTVGDTSAVQGYQVFRSKKMNSGYGTKPIFTTKSGTAKTYKNTTVKKGTKYYYKVRAFVELDGQKYYSDWSNKAYRVAK